MKPAFDLQIILAIQRAEAAGHYGFAAALVRLLRKELGLTAPIAAAAPADPTREARRQAWRATRRSMHSRAPFSP